MVYQGYISMFANIFIYFKNYNAKYKTNAFIYKLYSNWQMIFFIIYVDIPNNIMCIKLYYNNNIIILKSII